MKVYAFLLVFLSSLTISAQKMLQYELKVDQTFKVEQQAKQHITQDIRGVDQIIDNNLKSTMQFKVVNVAQDLITLEMVFTHMKMTMSSPSLGELLSADTSIDDDTDITSKMFRGTLNIPVTMVMERTGKIRSISGGEKLIASMLKVANITDAATIEANTAQFEKQFGGEALSNSFEQMTYFLPAKPVQVDDSWKNTYNGDLESKNAWTLTSYNEDTYKVSGVAETTMSNIDENVMMVLTGTQETTINAHSKTGLFKDITVEGSYTGDTQVLAANMTIPTKITSTITYKLLN
ncbi:DUF6263 family protein [Gelidibacter salicanalis]|uniref:DUF4412 domain-containing protein n=1 Tax=Gelidibacter salicanalis TaxID=291193 RepID=A0A934KQS8_9FLAO|nr:DUF6263 family protein [Gelidibacter salicanalis]MBJ7881799.1 hypothetical protein [Gelidibacter salicanalis]